MERLLTPKETAEIMAVAPRTVKEWLRRGELTGVKVRNMWRIRESDLEKFIERGSLNPLNLEKKGERKKTDHQGGAPPFCLEEGGTIFDEDR